MEARGAVETAYRALKAALALAPLVFLRPGELRKAEWSKFDFEGATWAIPALRMKGRLKAKLNGPDHLVPLAPQAVAILRDLHPLKGELAGFWSVWVSGNWRLVFRFEDGDAILVDYRDYRPLNEERR